MAPELGSGVRSQASKKGRVKTSNFPYTQGPWNPFTPTSVTSKPNPDFRSDAYPSPLSSFTTSIIPPLVNLNPQPSPFSLSTSTISSPINTIKNRTQRAPDSHAISTSQTHLGIALREATKRATLAELNAADHLHAKANMERQLQDRQTEATDLITTNKHITAETETLKTDLAKLQKHTRNCEKATNNAQKEAQHAKGYEAAARELREWKERYGWVGKPAQEKAALQKTLSEWQSKADKAQNEIARLKGALRGQQPAWEPQISIKTEENDTDTEGEEDQSLIKIEEEEDASTALAEAQAQAAKYKAERDTLHRVLQEEMGRNAKLAESLPLRNAKVADVLGGLDR